MTPLYGQLGPTNGCDRFTSLGHPSKFQRVSLRRLGFVFITATTSLSGGQRNFARCLAFSWAGTLYVHFWGHLMPGAKFTLSPSLAFYIGSVTARHSGSRRQASFAAWYKEWNCGSFAEGATPPIFGWAAIMLGIGPHSSYILRES